MYAQICTLNDSQDWFDCPFKLSNTLQFIMKSTMFLETLLQNYGVATFTCTTAHVSYSILFSLFITFILLCVHDSKQEKLHYQHWVSTSNSRARRKSS